MFVLVHHPSDCIMKMTAATLHGGKHRQIGVNNQDALATQTFEVPALGKTYQVGLVSDGCTGIPAFSRSEVGSNLLVTFALGRIQQLICSGAELEAIPRGLYLYTAEFLRQISSMVIPEGMHWPYPGKFKGDQEYRNTISATGRFRTDYLAATLIGFISDGHTIVTFSAGDGIILVNDDLNIIEQNDRPDYIGLSINRPNAGFVTRKYVASDVHRLVISTDGLKDLFSDPQFRLDIFDPSRMLRGILVERFERMPEKMADDCTVICLNNAKEAI